MIYPVKTDLIPLLENLVAAIQPFASANFVQLRFSSGVEKADVTHHPEVVVPILTQLLCRVITLTPQENVVRLEVLADDQNVRVRVSRTGVSQDQIREIASGFQQQISVCSGAEGGTVFEMLFPKGEETSRQKEDLVSPLTQKKYVIPPFFKRLKDSLHAYFTSLKHLEQAASAQSEREGAFLKKVNAVIFAHLDQEYFDMPALSKALALSRSQLYRRLKPLIRQGPAHYIKFVRLQKAKALLDDSNLTIGEIAFRTGFRSQSHFTRAFHEQFGFNPSDLKRSKRELEDGNSGRLPNLNPVKPDPAHDN
jgi:AraC-like DNA-binding protein